MTKVHRFVDVPWHVPPADPNDLDLETEAPADGPGRKYLAQGEGGFWTQMVRIPAGFTAPVHAHDHAEVFMVTAGDCVFNGEPMHPLDLTIVQADEEYSFTAGTDGVQFLVVRGDKASYIAR